tara:strand:+ start:1644 stop:1853 length:210 start_codon:yes stop_codon:yes gene_type:complete
MAQISPKLFEQEWETYNGLKGFLKNKETSFGDDMNQKYKFTDDKLLELNDYDAYTYIKERYVLEIKDMK